jgi:hypothetical protein
MNRKTINDTKTIRFSEIDDGYVITSPLFPHIVGFGETEQEAHEAFAISFEGTYMAFLEGRLAGAKQSGKGRPAKGLAPLDANVHPETRKWVDAIANKLGLSLGEVMDMAMYCLVFQSKVVEPVLDFDELSKIEKQFKKERKQAAKKLA